MGAFNIVGTIMSGWICDRYGQKVPPRTTACAVSR